MLLFRKLPTDPLYMAQTDRDALLALYNATDGANWENGTSWNTDAPLSGWYGVETNGEGRVWTLSLNYNSLRGTLELNPSTGSPFGEHFGDS